MAFFHFHSFEAERSTTIPCPENLNYHHLTKINNDIRKNKKRVPIYLYTCKDTQSKDYYQIFLQETNYSDI